MKALFSHYKKLHLWLLADLTFLAAFLLARQSRGAMNALTEGFTNPLRRAIGQFCERVPFSVAESLYVLAALGFLAFLVLGVRAVARSRHRSGTVYALSLIHISSNSGARDFVLPARGLTMNSSFFSTAFILSANEKKFEDSVNFSICLLYTSRCV